MRALWLVIPVLAAACQKPTEIRGLYVNVGAAGYLFTCDHPSLQLQVPDTGLAAAYRAKAPAAGRPMFARLIGVRADSGSIYTSQHYFLVRRVVEVREPASGECAEATRPFMPATRSRPATASATRKRWPRWAASRGCMPDACSMYLP